MLPTNDWALLDIFTTALHPNVTRGRLSVNQTNLAAWSAVLSGVTLSGIDQDPGTGTPIPIDTVSEPAVFSNAVERVVSGLIRTKNSKPNGQFISFGDFLSVREFTFKSPFLTNLIFRADEPNGTEYILDSDYERLPERILSLLKVGEPRFVIYAWGQSLKPARNGVPRRNDGTIDLNAPLTGPSITINPGQPDHQVVNNYQVTGESATRAVVRVVFPEKLGLPEVGLNHPNFGKPDYRKPRVVVESFNVIPVE
jgi:hypothetical protein